MVDYALNQGLILLILLVPYLLFYRNSSLFTINRIYLWTSLLLSIVAPLMSFEVFKNEIHSIINSTRSEVVSLTSGIENVEISSSYNGVGLIYMVGALLAFGIFVWRLFNLYSMMRSMNWIKQGAYYVSNQAKTTSSFFNFIMLEEDSLVKQNHEIAHAKLGHSFDRLALELIRCMLWYNPFIYLFKRMLVENHEFSADAAVLQTSQIHKSEYCNLLIAAVKSYKPQLEPLNSFYSLTKYRLQMLAKNKTPHKALYLLMLPVLFAVFCSFTFKTYTVYISPDGLVMRDTIPGEIYIVDTISVFNLETKTEEIKVVKNITTINDFESRIVFSGEMKTVVDTISIFDAETFAEELVVLKKIIPIEIYRLAPYIPDSKNYNLLEKAHSKSLTLFFQGDSNSNVIYDLDEDVELEVTNVNSGTKRSIHLDTESNSFKPKDAKMTSGKYTIRIVQPVSYSAENITIIVE